MYLEPVTIVELREFEREFNIKFPETYSAFLLNGNVAQDWMSYTYRYKDQEDRAIISGFLSLRRIERSLKLLQNRIPDKYIPIGSTPGGDLIIICLESENYGNIFHWNHEEEDENNLMFNIYFISEKFADFINALEKVQF